MIFVPVGEPDAQLVHVGPVALLADDGLAGEGPVLVHQQLRVLAQMAGGGQRRRWLRVKGQFLGRFADPICTLMRIRIQIFTIMRIRIQSFISMWIRIQIFTLMRIQSQLFTLRIRTRFYFSAFPDPFLHQMLEYCDHWPSDPLGIHF
jgi:hypothetical protein